MLQIEEIDSEKFQKKKVISSFFWRFAERCGAQGVLFIVSIILARLLAPEIYGTVALVTVFTTILQVFVDSGMANALIQKKDADETDFSTVFFFNIITCGLLYLGMYVIAPLIAGFYNNSELTDVIRVLSLTLVISGVKNIQQAYVSRNMLFKRFFYATLGGTLVAAVVGIAMAYKGFGVWALVIQQVLNAFVDTVILWLTVKWRPQKIFSFHRLKGLFSYGWKMLVSGLLDSAYGNIRQLIIGKMYSSSDLAYYNRGRQFPNFIVSNINSSIDSVLFPVMSSVQDDREAVKQMTRKSIKTSVYIMAPLMMGLAFMADTVVSLVLTDKWSECVPFLRIFCITFMFYPIHTANLNAINAMGRSDLFLKLEVIKKVVGIGFLLSTMRFGVMAMAYSMLATSVAGQIINSWPNRKLLHYGYLEQIKDILPSILLAMSMGCCVGLVGMLDLPLGVKLFAQVMLGAELYVIGSGVFNLDSFNYLRRILKSTLKKTL
ncbi:MAG: lipopolysaccharide biosynthesis protein [Clostridia bacterium]|nr:lipopolysaccharide biosynthesis protein [Clostridia bacterium]